jgi:uncharacterized protein
MRTRLLNDNTGQKTFVAVLETGDEVMECLLRFAEAEGLTAAQLTAIGAFRTAELNFFEWEKKEYRSIPVDEQTEVASMIGDIARGAEGKPVLHIHIVLGKRDGSALAGHLSRGDVRPTLEVIISEAPAHLRRRKDAETGLPLIDLGNSDG